jgi:hypothetical protein
MTNEKDLSQSTSGAFKKARELIQKSLKEKGLNGSDVFAEMMENDRLSKLSERANERRNNNKPSDSYLQSLEDNAKDLYDAQLSAIDEDFFDINFDAMDELDELPPLKMLAHATTHTCPEVKLGGVSWQTWLKRGQECPMCGVIALDEFGNAVEK